MPRLPVGMRGAAIAIAGGVARRADRQAHHERRSLRVAAARRVDGPAVELDEVAHDREPEPEAAVLAREPGVG